VRIAPALIYSASGEDQGAESDADSDGSLDRVASIKRNLREVVNSTRHKLTHKGDTRRCNICRRGKARNKGHRKGGFKRDSKQFGDLFTMDHILMKDWYDEPRVGVYPDAFAIRSLHKVLQSASGIKQKSRRAAEQRPTGRTHQSSRSENYPIRPQPVVLVEFIELVVLVILVVLAVLIVLDSQAALVALIVLVVLVEC
jgi:hypothetical protein